MKQYRKVANCGPVPYPDDSHRYLTDETVAGDGWEPLVALGFVEEVAAEISDDNISNNITIVDDASVSPSQEYRVIKNSNKTRKDRTSNRSSKNVIISEANNAQASDRRGTKEVDNQEAGRVADIDPAASKGSPI